ncbi:wax ester/triacylglycerol synthase family O-acyltransferase [Saccharothrix variisporea]|uniref:Diacylglycerol O-acyltransferase n=1 Tax=Saccharothrix variisporea TaxID=543527 RepID=A0A495XQ07_9PSEU|nr:wax ester/triacylglycerol synthase family O-acyltransferase [Saccharothrix variisporea]RKT74533.1 diacylglycerol O-acyltransferase [Saccharothrix variisporea]
MNASTQRLGVLDTAFLDVEDADPHVSLAIGSVAIVAGPPPTHDEFVARVGPRLLSLPGATARVRRRRFGAPELVRDRLPDPDHHIRRVAVTSPGDDTALHELVASIMARRLDRDRPLWECWVVEGLSGGRWAVLFKVHHCLVDGVGGVDLLTALCADDPDAPGARPAPPVPRSPLRSAPPLPLAPLRTAPPVPRSPLRTAPPVPRWPLQAAIPVPWGPLQAVRQVLRGTAGLAGAAVPVAPSSLVGPIGSRRRYRVVRASLTDVAAAGRAHGATVNDVVLAAVSAGLRDLLTARGEPTWARAVRALVPVSVRHAATGVEGNAISVRLPFLPIHITHPVEALEKVHRAMRHHAATGESDAGQALLALARHACPTLLSSGVRLGARLPQRSITTVTTNVPGPRHPLSLIGRDVIEVLPYVPIALGLRTGVAALSYRDRLVLGITGDHDSTPDLDVLASGIERGLSRLVEPAARSRQSATAAARQGPQDATSRVR